MFGGTGTLLQPESTGLLVSGLIDLFIKSLLVLSVAGLATAVMRRVSAARRHLIWCAALCSLLALPLLATLLPSWNLSLVPAPAPVEQVVTPASRTGNGKGVAPGGDLAPARPAGAAVPRDVASRARTGQGGSKKLTETAETGLLVQTIDVIAGVAREATWQTWIVLLWLTGLVVILAQLVLSAVTVWQLSRTARPVQDPAWLDLVDELGDRLFVTRPVRLLKTPHTTTPMTWGVWRPVVLIPVDADEWPEQRRRCVLTHELAHVQRWDTLTQMVAQLACAVCWFNPLAWIGLRHVRIEREKACDDLVLEYGTRASDYASHLLEVARAVRSRLLSPLGAVAMARPSQLEGRVLAILDERRRRRRIDRRMTLAASAGALLLLVPLAAMRPWAAPVPPAADEAAAYGASGGEARAATPTPAPTPTPSPSPSPAVAHRPAQTATRSDDDPRIQGLIKALKDEEADVREQAAWALGQLEATSAVPALGDVLTSDESAEVRHKAAWALGEIGSFDATPLLMQGLDDEEADVRAMVAWALGQLDDPASVDGIVAHLATEANPEARSKLAWALGQIGDPRGVDGLMAVIHDPDLNVRQTAVWALGQIEDARSVPALSEAVKDDNGDVRAKAVWALGQIEDPGAVPALLTIVRDDPDVEVRRQAVWALGQIEAPEAVAPLTVALKDDDAKVRSQAAWALGEIEDRGAVAALADVLVNDASVDVRRQAAWALGQIEDPASIDALTKALEDEDADVRRQAVRALGEIDGYRSGDANRDDDRDSNQDYDAMLDARWQDAVNVHLGGLNLGDIVDVGLSGAQVGLSVAQEVLNAIAGSGALRMGDVDGLAPSDAYVRSMKAAGFDHASDDDLVAADIFGVTPSYAEEIRRLGYDPGLDDLVELRIAGVDAAYLKDMADAGIGGLELNRYADMSVVGVDAAFVRKLQKARRGGLSADQIIQARVLSGNVPQRRVED